MVFLICCVEAVQYQLTKQVGGRGAVGEVALNTELNVEVFPIISVVVITTQSSGVELVQYNIPLL